MTKDMDLPENKASAWLRYDEAVNRETFDVAEMGSAMASSATTRPTPSTSPPQSAS